MTLRALSSMHSDYVMPPGPISRMRHCGAGCATEASPLTLCALPRSFPERNRLCFTHCKYCCDNCVISAEVLLRLSHEGDEMRTISPDPPKLLSAGEPSCHCKGKPRLHAARPPSICGCMRSKDSCFVSVTHRTETGSS